MLINQFDTVRILKIKKKIKTEKGTSDKILPKVGDVATIVEIYNKPVIGYELESVDQNGQTRWLVAFKEDEVELLVINKGN